MKLENPAIFKVIDQKSKASCLLPFLVVAVRNRRYDALSASLNDKCKTNTRPAQAELVEWTRQYISKAVKSEA